MKKFFLLFFFFPLLVDAQEVSRSVIFNEIAWMGNTNSANDEWIELANVTSAPIDLAGWRIMAEDNSPSIQLLGVIPPAGYFLLERTDDTSVPNVSADIIYTGALENKGEKLGLYDASGNLIDEIDALSGWPAGDNTAKQTMERAVCLHCEALAKQWQTSAKEGGTPKTANSAPEQAGSLLRSQTKKDAFSSSFSPFFLALPLALSLSLLTVVGRRRLFLA